MKQTFFLFVIVLFVFSCSKSNLENEQYDESTDFPDNEGAIIDPLNSGGAYLQWDDSYLFHSPLDQLNLIFGFGLKNPEFNNQYHLGQDLLTSQFSSVYSIADGKIVFKNFYPNHSSKKNGKTITVQSWGGIAVLQVYKPEKFFVVYGHLDKDNLPALGTTVTKGQIISKVESDAVHTWITHIHFQLGLGDFTNIVPAGYIGKLSDNTTYVDPFEYLKKFKSTNAINTEIANGIDDDINGIIDDCADCWKAIYRFVDKNTGARCWNDVNTPPNGYSNYTTEIEAWVAATSQIPNTYHLVQCSKSTDHILVEKNSSDYTSLKNAGYTETADLGFVWKLGKSDKTKKYLGNSYQSCPVYRFSYSANGLGAHLFSRGGDDLQNMNCESPARFEVITSNVIFPGIPCN